MTCYVTQQLLNNNWTTVYFALTWRLISAIRSGFNGNSQPGASPDVRVIFAAIFLSWWCIQPLIKYVLGRLGSTCDSSWYASMDIENLSIICTICRTLSWSAGQSFSKFDCFFVVVVSATMHKQTNTKPTRTRSYFEVRLKIPHKNTRLASKQNLITIFCWTSTKAFQTPKYLIISCRWQPFCSPFWWRNESMTLA